MVLTRTSRPIDQQLTVLETNIKAKPNLKRFIKMELEQLVRKVYSESIAQHNGWCMTFKVPESDVLNLPEQLGLDIDTLSGSFSSQWAVPKTAHMVNNPYYHTLLFFVTYGLRTREESVVKSSLTLLLIKIWNGRRRKFIPFCNADVMRYVVANMSGKYLMRKHDSPMMMIMNHYCPTLVKKYGDKVKQDSSYTKRLFDQCWNRIRQLFVSDMAPNITTGKSEARSGIAPLYFEAKKRGLKIETPSISKIADTDSDTTNGGVAQAYTSHIHDQLVGDITNYIVVDIEPKYDPGFIRFVNRETSARSEKITIILSAIHSIRYTDYISDILELMFNQLQIEDKADYCTPQFFTMVKRKIISSKHSQTIVHLKNVVDMLLEKIFEDRIKYVPYSNYSAPMRGKLRNIVFYGFAYNIQKYLCAG